MKTLFYSLVAIFSCTLLTAKPEKAKQERSEQEQKVTHVDAETSKKLLAGKDAPVIIDLRTPVEFKEGHIDGAENIDFLDKSFSRKLAKLDKDQAYLIHCQSGRRSTNSLETFKKLGFKHIYHLGGGYLAWKKSGKE